MARLVVAAVVTVAIAAAADVTLIAADTNKSQGFPFICNYGMLNQSLDLKLTLAAKAVTETSIVAIKEISHMWGFPFFVGLIRSISGSTDKDVALEATVDKDTCSALGAMVDTFPVSEKAFTSSIVDGVFVNGRSKSLKNIFADTVKSNSPSFHDPMIDWQRDHGSKQFAGMTVQTGGGFGFGFQIFCGCQLVLSSGMGWGGGFQSAGHQIQGGQGGGGGIQLWNISSDNITKMRASLGGGGGGALENPYGSQEDPDQFVDAAFVRMDDLFSAFSVQIKKCPFGELSISAGGGGGYGFSANFTDGSSPNITYGGGHGFGAHSINFGRISKSCNGTMDDRSANKEYEEINEQIPKCKNKCTKSGPAAQQCNCACVRDVYLLHNETWANHICCPNDPPSENCPQDTTFVL